MDTANSRRSSSSSAPRIDEDEALANDIADLGLVANCRAQPRRFDARIARLKQREEDLQRLMASVRYAPRRISLVHRWRGMAFPSDVLASGLLK